MNRLKELIPQLSCPDDHSPLVAHSGHLICPLCRRDYPVLGENFIDLLPGSPSFNNDHNTGYQSYYQREFSRQSRLILNAKAWGRLDLNTASWATKRRRQVKFVSKLLSRTPVICDVSAGGGAYTFDLVKHFPLVIHCDLSIVNLSDVYRRKQAQNINNLVLIRCDYFKLPFNHSMPQIICLDTLIRGQFHEMQLLSSLLSAISKTGTILADFHNWWHNPLRRMGLLPNNFDTSYTQKQTEKLLKKSGIKVWDHYPFHQEIPPETNSFLRKVLPPTRLLYKFKNNENSANS